MTDWLAINPPECSLLAERFGLAIDRADKQSPIFALALGKGKPKLKKTAATGWAPKSKDTSGRPGLNTVTCQNTTMDSFAERLCGLVAAYFNYPVVNKTGLEGAYDFTITWTLRSAERGPTDPDCDPNTSISIFEAVEQQLGLKLESPGTNGFGGPGGSGQSDSYRKSVRGR